MGVSEAIDVLNERMGTTASKEEMEADELAIRALDKQLDLEDLIGTIEYEGCGDSVIKVSYFLELLYKLRV